MDDSQAAKIISNRSFTTYILPIAFGSTDQEVLLDVHDHFPVRAGLRMPLHILQCNDRVGTGIPDHSLG